MRRLAMLLVFFVIPMTMVAQLTKEYVRFGSNLIAVENATVASPVAAFRTTAGIVLLVNGIWINTGMVTALSDPAVAVDTDGQIYLAVRDQYNSIWVRRYNPATNVWTPSTNWEGKGGVVNGQPSMVVNGGTMYLAVNVGTTPWLWYGTIGGGSGTWTSAGGSIDTDPAIAKTCGSDVYLVGRVGTPNGALWSRRFNGSWNAWLSHGGTTKGDPGVVGGPGCNVYVATRDQWDAAYMMVFQGDTTAGTWTLGNGVLGASLRIANSSGGLMVVSRDASGAGGSGTPYRRAFIPGSAPGSGWQGSGWTSLGGNVIDVTVAGDASSASFLGLDTVASLWWWVGGSWSEVGNGTISIYKSLNAGPQ